eukprot:s5078_g2.t1
MFCFATKKAAFTLQVYLDTLAQKSPDVKRFFQETLVAQHSGKESISGCVYADEAVPGNIIAPDNRRRSWCIYFAWDCWIPCRSDVLWLPMAIIRSDIIEHLPGGLPEALNIVMRQCLPFFSGIVVEDSLIVTSPLSLLADEDGLKKLAEKLSGWKFNEHSWVWDNTLWNLLKPSRCIYDAVRCIFGNGIAWLQLGFFDKQPLTMALVALTFFRFCAPIGSEVCKSATCLLDFPALAGPKLLKDDGSDYRGDSSQTLELVALMSSFAQQALSGIEELEDKIASLAARTGCVLQFSTRSFILNNVQVCLLFKKNIWTFSKSVTQRNGAGPNITTACILNLHIERQVATFHMLMDAWPTERKHKVFKSDLAPRIKRLGRFERSIMTRWVEHDLETLACSNFLNHLLQPLKEEISGMQFARGAYSNGCTLRTNNVLLFKKEDVWQAFLVVTCLSSTTGPDLPD